MKTVRLACQAMATRFELVLPGEDAVRLRAAGEEALEEIVQWEAELSLYRPSSEVAKINREAARAPVRVSPPVFELLQQCRELWRLSDGAFDITVAPLVRTWGFMTGQGRVAPPEEVAAAHASVGMAHLELDPDRRTVRFTRPGMMLDLGAVGKGYAVDRAIETLRELGVTRAFLHGGTSSCYGLGVAPEGTPWRVAVKAEELFPETDAPSPAEAPLAVATLENAALSVSGVRDKAIRVGGRLLGHVIDPRTGEPVTGAILAAVTGRSTAETDALSTALLVSGAPGMARLAEQRPDPGWLCATREADGTVQVEHRHWPGD